MSLDDRHQRNKFNLPEACPIIFYSSQSGHLIQYPKQNFWKNQGFSKHPEKFTRCKSFGSFVTKSTKLSNQNLLETLN